MILFCSGLALIDRPEASPQDDNSTIKYFPVSELPPTGRQRFQKLFAERAKWTKSEIEPYLKDLFAIEGSLDQLLFKYCRTSQSKSGETMYSSRL